MWVALLRCGSRSLLGGLGCGSVGGVLEGRLAVASMMGDVLSSLFDLPCLGLVDQVFQLKAR